MRQFCEETGFIGFYETSARTGQNIDAAGRSLVKYIIDNKVEPFSEGHGVDLTAPDGKHGEDGPCC